MDPIALIDEQLFDQHVAPTGHPERPARLKAARAALGTAGLTDRMMKLPAQAASDDQLGRAHHAGYIHQLDQAAGRQGYLDPDTYVAPGSVAAARRAAGGAVQLASALVRGEVRHGVALLRPPGHHARPGAAMGFCLLNNVAVAAAHARSLGLGRICIVDFDVHHGNGTQEIFYDDPTVLYISLHQYPFYPGTGGEKELGRGDGTGFTINIPLSAGATDAVYFAALGRLVLPILEQYRPELLLLSAGFDAHARDPLAQMQLSEHAFEVLTGELVGAMKRATGGGSALLLEGGYDLAALEASLAAALRGLVEPGAKSERLHAADLPQTFEDELQRAAGAFQKHWKLA